MKPTIDKLQSKASSLAATEAGDKAAEAGVAQEERVHALLDKWGSQNLLRSAISLVGAVCGTLAALSQDQANAVDSVSRVGFTSGANRLG